jgi:hypothetical protein
MPISGRRVTAPVTDDELEKWERDWASMMVVIWREKILALGIIDTMSLTRSITPQVIDYAGGRREIIHEFLMRGIYMARGVGNGYDRGNGGDLQILDKQYRILHGLNKPRSRGPSWSRKHLSSGQPRQQRDWIMRRYLSSLHVLDEVELAVSGEQYMGAVSNFLQLIFSDAPTWRDF